MAIQSNKLKICAWNACGGLYNKKAEIENFLNTRKIDILLLSETLVKNPTKFNFIGYKTYKHKNENNRGTAVIVKCNLVHHEITINLETIEATAIKIKSHGSEIAIISTYNSPSKKFNKTDYDKLFRIAPTVISAGDYNAKHTRWGSRSINTLGSKLSDYCLKHDLDVHAPAEFTHYPNNKRYKPDIIDFVITKDLKFSTNVVTVHELDSDHYPIEIIIDLDISYNIPQPRYNFAKTDWNVFQTYINDNIQDTYQLESTEHIDTVITSLTETITQAIEHSTPLRDNKFNSEPLPDNILTLIKERNLMRTEQHKRPNSNLGRTINRYRKIIAEKIKDFRSETWNKSVKKLNIKDNSLYRMTKVLTRARTNIPPLKDDNNEIKYFSPEDKANRFAENFAKTFTPHNNPSDTDFIAETDKIVADYLNQPCTDEFKKVSGFELKNYFRKTKNNKAPGPDRISNFVLKHLPSKALKILAEAFNACFKLSYFPNQWKKALILVFAKAGKDLTLPTSYRPISLLNTMSKALEAVTIRRLKREIKKKNLIRDEQFGFRDGHSTQHQILRLTEFITKNYNWKNNTGAVLLDVEKAFDSVWINGLLRKLIDAGIPKRLIHLLASYLKNRFFEVTLDGSNSNQFPIKAGVPQGSLLGPILFSLYINDIPGPNNRNFKIGIYADDTVIYGTSMSNKVIVKNLNETLNNINIWCTKWRVKINAAKSEAILFSRKRNPTKNLTPPLLNETPIPWKKSVKYLGVTLDQKLSYSQHTTNARNKAAGALAKLRPLIRNHSALGIKNGKIILKTFIRPILTYASTVWGGTCKTNIQKLQIMQNKTLRAITNAPRYTTNELIHRELEIEYIKDYVAEAGLKFYNRAAESEYELIRKLGNYDYDPLDKYRRPKDFLVIHDLNKTML